MIRLVIVLSAVGRLYVDATREYLKRKENDSTRDRTQGLVTIFFISRLTIREIKKIVTSPCVIGILKYIIFTCTLY